MSLIDEITIAQRNAGEQAVIDNLKKFDIDIEPEKSKIKCKWHRAFDQHFNISCDSGERANGNFKSCDDMSGKWEFKYCPYCGREIEVVYAD